MRQLAELINVFSSQRRSLACDRHKGRQVQACGFQFSLHNMFARAVRHPSPIAPRAPATIRPSSNSVFARSSHCRREFRLSFLGILAPRLNLKLSRHDEDPVQAHYHHAAFRMRLGYLLTLDCLYFSLRTNSGIRPSRSPPAELFLAALKEAELEGIRAALEDWLGVWQDEAPLRKYLEL